MTFARTTLRGVFAVLVSSAVLWGCQTAQQGQQSVDPKEDEAVRKLFAGHCVQKLMPGANLPDPNVIYNQSKTLSASGRHGGWRMVLVEYRGHRDTVYYHGTALEVVCGAKNWQAYLDGKHKPFKLPDSNERTATKRDETRSITVQWEGYADMFTGTIREVSDGSKGTVAVALPKAEGYCTGEYQFTERMKGIWAIKCDNGMAARGEFTALGAGKGAVGTGVDTKGRKVTYTLGGQT